MSEPEGKINAVGDLCISRAELREILKADTVEEAFDKHHAVPETTHWVETAGDPSAAPVFAETPTGEVPVGAPAGPGTAGRMIYRLDCGSEDAGNRELFYVEGPAGLDLEALEAEFDSGFPPRIKRARSAVQEAQQLINDTARRKAFGDPWRHGFTAKFITWLCEKYGCTPEAKGITFHMMKND
jgi:hypothetical protein